jgi:hypothetical protein
VYECTKCEQLYSICTCTYTHILLVQAKFVADVHDALIQEGPKVALETLNCSMKHQEVCVCACVCVWVCVCMCVRVCVCQNAEVLGKMKCDNRVQAAASEEGLLPNG